MKGKVIFIGAGPGDPDLVTVKGRNVIEKADVIVYAGSLVNKEVLNPRKLSYYFLSAIRQFQDQHCRKVPYRPYNKIQCHRALAQGLWLLPW